MMIAACFIYILRQNARSLLFESAARRAEIYSFAGGWQLFQAHAANRFEIHRRHSSRVRAIAAPHHRALSRLICMKQRFSHSRARRQNAPPSTPARYYFNEQ